MSSEKWLLFGVILAAAGYIYLKNRNNWTTATIKKSAIAAGYTVQTPMYDSHDLLISSGGTTFGFREGDAENLNWAQRFLLANDAWIPGDWTKKVYTGALW